MTKAILFKSALSPLMVIALLRIIKSETLENVPLKINSLNERIEHDRESLRNKPGNEMWTKLLEDHEQELNLTAKYKVKEN